MTPREYEARIPPLTRHYMEVAETNRLARNGAFRKEQEEREGKSDKVHNPEDATSYQKTARWTSKSGPKPTSGGL